MSTSAHFSDTDMACPCCKKNLCVDKLLLALEQLRTAIGDKPIIVDSGYRCAAKNKAVGGASNSRHLQGMAADIRVNGMSPIEVYNTAKTIPFFGGFGVAHGFTHLDVRTTITRWCYDHNNKEIPWDKTIDA